jgi:hypothetical protein
MSERARRPTIGQALISLCVVAAIAVIAFSAISSAAVTISQKRRALAEFRENIRHVEARLVAAREESAQRLASFGAGLGDLETLADAARIHALLEGACRSALGGAPSKDDQMGLSCAMNEAPFDNAAAYHQARLTVSDEVEAVAGRLPMAVRRPVRVRALTIEAGMQSPTITIILEAPGARSGGAE